ncbi:MAG: haloacid dehalogenase-like hydrolase [Myxococcaceae bacterium]|jgi:phosphoglycolate phosphatase|nr:haloacid dehalogenase-like hydrolase [Myxococcaceae bacterium]
MPLRPTVLLFDIDGTLLTAGSAGRRAIRGAFEQRYGRADACDHFSFGGMTDQAIARQGLEAIGVSVTPAAVAELLATYVGLLEHEVQRVPDAEYRVFPGVLDAVEVAHARGYAVGLGTGNVRAGATVKLRRVGLHLRFDFGGFGDDAELRPELIRHGAERGAARLGRPRSETRVVVIGDTPKDVEAARAIGADCVAVATGGFPVEALVAAGATWAFADLTAPGALEAVVTGR